MEGVEWRVKARLCLVSAETLPVYSYFLSLLLCSGHFANPKVLYLTSWE